MILVTGGSGFIGSHVVETLAAGGHRVRCVVRRTAPPVKLPCVEYARGDLLTGEGLEAALDGVDQVIHLAGTTKALRPADYYLGNARATANLVNAMKRSSARLVHVSSLAAAGPSGDGVPVDEAGASSPFTDYGRSKLEAEQAAADRAGTVIVRPPVVYGPRDTDVFQILRAVSRGMVLEIAGGERYFSAIYVKDLAAGLIAAALHPAACGTYYLTYPHAHSWSELVGVAGRLLGRRPRVVRVPYGFAFALACGAELVALARGKPFILSRQKVAEARCTHWTCSPARAARELGFTASTSLKSGLAQTIAWYKEAGWIRS